MSPPSVDPVSDRASDLVFGRPFDAVSLDVGGVLVLPDHGVIAHALRRRDIPFDRDRFTEGHYRAMAEVDRCLAEPETFTDYYRGFLGAVGVPDDHLELAAAILADVLVPPLWHQRIPGAIAAAQRLADAGLRLAVTSNADGTIEDSLRRHEIVQVGPGPGVEVEHLSDSGVLGSHKPDPGIFLATAAGLGLPPERICHIGDGGVYDAEGAAAVGMVAVHVDPLELCPGDHHHVDSLSHFADQVVRATVGGGA
jgi:FMN phosphatase YigB (HAD superfamily)